MHHAGGCFYKIGCKGYRTWHESLREIGPFSRICKCWMFRFSRIVGSLGESIDAKAAPRSYLGRDHLHAMHRKWRRDAICSSNPVDLFVCSCRS